MIASIVEGWQAMEPPRPPDPDAPDPTKELQRSFVRAFSSNDGAAVLERLRRMTLECALPPSATDAELRHTEGQRALVRYILNMIEQGEK